MKNIRSRTTNVVFVVFASIFSLFLGFGRVLAFTTVDITTQLIDSQVHWDATQYGQAQHFIVDNYGNYVSFYYG